MSRGYWFETWPIYSHLKSCEALAAQHRAEDLRRERRGYETLLERKAGLPEPGEGITLEEYVTRYEVDKENRTAVGLAVRFAATCAGGKLPKTGFTLSGQFGCGKTTLLLALGRSLARARQAPCFTNVPEEMEHLKGLMKSGGLHERLELLSTARVLLLDDLGRERSSTWTVDQVLYTVLDARYRSGLPTICTSNETQASLQARFETVRGDHGERAASAVAVIDRLRERAPWIVMGGASRRKPEWDF